MKTNIYYNHLNFDLTCSVLFLIFYDVTTDGIPCESTYMLAVLLIFVQLCIGYDNTTYFIIFVLSFSSSIPFTLAPFYSRITLIVLFLRNWSNAFGMFALNTSLFPIPSSVIPRLSKSLRTYFTYGICISCYLKRFHHFLHFN